MITYCDVNTCEDCPRYGDDCDGDKKVEHTDYISRADAIEAIYEYFMQIRTKAQAEIVVEDIPSADAEPTVIRSRTLMPTNGLTQTEAKG